MAKKYQREIPHIQQSTEIRNCGAVCIKMIYDSHGITTDLDAIWDEVKMLSPNRMYYCRNKLMLEHWHNKGYQACYVSVDNIVKTLNGCDKHGIDVIFNHKISHHNNAGHMSVYLYTDHQGVHVNDPMQAGGNRILKWGDFNQLMKKDGNEIVEDNSMLLINLSATQLPTVTVDCDGSPEEVFTFAFPYAKHVISTAHDLFFPVP